MVRNPLAAPAEVVVRHFVTDPDNKACAEFETKQTIPAGETATVKAAGKIAHPKLWDIGQPNLYTVRTEISVGGQVERRRDRARGIPHDRSSKTIAFS